MWTVLDRGMLMKFFPLSLAFFLAASICLFEGVKSEKFGCLNPEGKFVDWWFIYKESKGTRYFYKDSKTSLNLDQSRLLDHIDSPLSRTILSSGFLSKTKARNTPIYLTWNDQPAKGTTRSADFAHAKGFMGMKNSAAGVVESFLIQHSMPRFPLKNEELFGSNKKHKAQHFLCISMRDQFSGQRAANHNIPVDSVRNCNFYKLLANYTEKIAAPFYEMADIFEQNLSPFVNILDQFKPSRTPTNHKLTKDISSFTIESTGTEESALKIQIFAKPPGKVIDIYDDVTALFSVHHDDYKKNDDPVKTGHYKNQSAMLMITQSYADPSFLGINEKTLLNNGAIFAKVHILNSSEINLPTEFGHKKQQLSMYHDHSKWSVNIIYGHTGPFPPLLCFYDLNRTTKQAVRGGGAFCLNSSVTGSSRASLELWEKLISFCPKPKDLGVFQNLNIDQTLKALLPLEFDDNSTTPTYDLSGSASLLSPPRSERLIQKNSSEQDRMSEDEVPTSSSIKKRSLSNEHANIDYNPTAMKRGNFSSNSMELSVMEEYIYSGEDMGRCKVHHFFMEKDKVSKLHCPYEFYEAGRFIRDDLPLPHGVTADLIETIVTYGTEKINRALGKERFKIQKLIPIDTPGMGFMSGSRFIKSIPISKKDLDSLRMSWTDPASIPRNTPDPTQSSGRPTTSLSPYSSDTESYSTSSQTTIEDDDAMSVDEEDSFSRLAYNY